MVEVALYPVPAAAQAATRTTAAQAEAARHLAHDDPDSYWREQTARLDWMKSPTTMGNWSFDPVDIKWFEDGVLNVSANCLDRHLAEHGDDIAIVWEADDPAVAARRISYRALHEDTCRMANALVGLGVEKGDRVTLYLPMIPEAAVAMLACARVGAVHSVVFAGFSPDAIAGRISDAGSRFVITADGGHRADGESPISQQFRVKYGYSQCPIYIVCY